MKLEELSHILISVVTISIAFTIADIRSLNFSKGFATTFTALFLTIGVGFVLHELAHRNLARKYGAWAEFRSWTLGLVIALAMAITTGFVFAAPGATYIYGPHLTKEKLGKIALIGPLTNLALAIVFLIIGVIMPGLRQFTTLGSNVNLFLGVFNMIPVFVFDGKKVYDWDKGIWAVTSLILVIGLFII